MPSTFPAARLSRPARRARRVARALQAPSERKWLWLRALALVSLVRLGLWTMPLRTLQVLVARLGRGRYSPPMPMQGPNARANKASDAAPAQVLGPAPGADEEAEDAQGERELNWAVTRAARFVPGASCLTQALSLQVLLARRGLHSRLCIGVRKGAASAFEAHAWVERGGRVLIGGEDTARSQSSGRDKWTPLTAWDLCAEAGAAHLSGGKRGGKP